MIKADTYRVATDASVALERGVRECRPREVDDVERDHRGLQQSRARLVLLHLGHDGHRTHHHHQDQVYGDEELRQITAITLHIQDKAIIYYLLSVVI